mgnify:CR=1 FL=1
MNDVKEEVLPIFLYLSRNRKSPSNEGLYSDQCEANRVQQCLDRITSLISEETKEHTRTFYNNPLCSNEVLNPKRI